MRVLITRPQQDAEHVAEALRVRGIDSAIAPMMVVESVPGAKLDLAGAQAVLLTSANGARALAEHTRERGTRILAVGDATTRAARNLEFFRVESAGGDLEDLVRLARTRLDPDGGVLIHAAGRDVAGDLAGRLITLGFTVRRVALYRAEAAREMPATAAAALTAGTIDAVLFFSPRTAATFVTLARQAGLEPYCERITALCLSQAVAEKAGALRWRAIEVADRPEQGRLLRLIDKVPAGGKP